MPATRLAPLLTCFALFLACATTPPRAVTTSLEAPGLPGVELDLRDGPRGVTWTLTSDPDRTAPGELRWYDALGELEGRAPLALDAEGRTSGRAPAFAATWQLALPLTSVGDVPSFLVAGGPMRPELVPGRSNLVYLLRIVAPDLAGAFALAAPIAAGRTDAPPRPAIEVLLHLDGRRTQGRRCGLRLRVSGTETPRRARVLLDGQTLVGPRGTPGRWDTHELHGWGQLEARVATEALLGDGPVRCLELQTGDRPGTLARAILTIDSGDRAGSEPPRAPGRDGP